MAGSGSSRGVVAALAAGYLLGAVPSADLVSRSSRAGPDDIRRVGSGNPGAANAADQLGRLRGGVVLLADVAKGVAAGRLGLALGGTAGLQFGAAAAVVGHCHPPGLPGRRRPGGKGVATSIGQVLVGFPAYFPVDVAVAGLTAALVRNRRAMVANTVASAAWVGCSVLWWRRRWPNLWGPEVGASLPVASAVSALTILDRFARSTPPPGTAS